jgi:hypothetical protein
MFIIIIITITIIIKTHNGALCGVYVDSHAANQLPPASKFQWRSQKCTLSVRFRP